MIIATLYKYEINIGFFFQGWQERDGSVIQVLAHSAITRFYRVEAKAWCLTSLPDLTRIRPRYYALTPILKHSHHDGRTAMCLPCIMGLGLHNSPHPSSWLLTIFPVLLLFFQR